MASGHPGDAVRQIHRLLRLGSAGGLTDGQLLERFAVRGGESAEAAFEALVARHGPMVLRVCRGLLRDPHDVDDAFQATFLVLVRKAGSIGERELLGPWLFGVARRVALKARAVAARRARREGGPVTDPPADEADAAWLDLRPVLDEEVARLPEKYRKPVVLCHWQGLTHAEAARELAWPVGTVSVRLARARKLLRDRLTRRGLTATASLWGAGLAADAASAAVPESLIRSTTMAALAAAAGRWLPAGMVPVGAAALARRTMTMMLVSRLKWLMIPLALGLGAAGGVVATREMMARRQPVPVAEKPAPAPEKAAGDSEKVAGDPESPELPRVEAVPPVVETADGRLEISAVPPGFFDLPTPAKKGEFEPPAAVKPGQILLIEVLEALPGRPITGERLVRPDGTISLGFYGDLPVAGLNRDQIKVKLLEHLRKYLIDEVLGLVRIDLADRKAKVNPPIESNRVFVDDSINYYPPDREIPGRSKRKGGSPDDPALNARLDMLEGAIHDAIWEVRSARGAANPPDATVPQPPTLELLEKMRARNDQLEIKLKALLKEVGRAREEGRPAGPPEATPPPASPPGPGPG